MIPKEGKSKVLHHSDFTDEEIKVTVWKPSSLLATYHICPGPGQHLMMGYPSSFQDDSKRQVIWPIYILKH